MIFTSSLQKCLCLFVGSCLNGFYGWVSLIYVKFDGYMLQRIGTIASELHHSYIRLGYYKLLKYKRIIFGCIVYHTIISQFMLLLETCQIQDAFFS